MTGKQIKELRQTLGWSQQRLAEELGISWISVSRWEREIKSPSPMARAILQHMEIKAGIKVSQEQIIDRITRKLQIILQNHPGPLAEEKVKLMAEQIYWLTQD